MNNSLLPQGHKIRVLTTIKDGKVTEQLIDDDQLILTVPDFAELAERANLLVTKETHLKATADALNQATEARELLCELAERQSDADTVECLYTAVDLMSEAIISLKEASAGS